MQENDTKLLLINFINSDNKNIVQELAPVETKEKKNIGITINFPGH